MSEKNPNYSPRLQALVDRCNTYRAQKEKLKQQGIEFDTDKRLPEIDDSGLDKPSEEV